MNPTLRQSPVSFSFWNTQFKMRVCFGPASGEPSPEILLQRPECAWITREIEQKAFAHAIAHVVPGHLEEVITRRVKWIEKTRAAVKERLTKEITYWDHRAAQLR